MQADTQSTPSGLAPIRRLEEATLSGWPSLRTIVDGAWVIRMARGQTGRANSVTILDPTDDNDLKARVDWVADLYARNGLPCLYRVSPLTPPFLIENRLAAGYAPFNETCVLVNSNTQCLPAARPIVPETAVSAQWLDAVARFSGFTPAKRSGLAAKLSMLALPAGFFLLHHEGQPAAAVLAIVQRDLIGIMDLAVAPRFRRLGLARSILSAAFSWGADLGGKQIWLQVVAGNTAAQALYAAAGFNELYRYHYIGAADD